LSDRLIVLVSGAPAAGKTTLATALAASLRLPLISKDDLKETLFDALDGPTGDLARSRRLGGAAMQLLWRLAERCPAAVVEATFRARSEYEQARLRQLQATIIEVHCACPADELARRFAVRARTAHPAHPLQALSADLIAELDQPMGGDVVIEVDTSQPVDVTALTARITALIRG